MGFQHLFQKRSTAKVREKADVTETYKTLIDARFDRLEQNFALLKGEWNDTYEKISLLYDRNRKRLQAIEKASSKEIPPEPDQPIQLTRENVLRAYLGQNGI